MPLPILPPAPSRDDPTNFAALADAFLAALPAWGNAANALEQSLQLVATTGTSVSSLTIGTGSKSITTDAGKAWVVGSFVYIVSAASVANYMQGQVTAYNSTTGALTVNVLGAVGSGTFASWVVGLSTAISTAGAISVADALNLFTASSVETVLTELFNNTRNAASQIAAASGTANALTASFTPAVTALTHGMVLYIRAASKNTGAATMQADATASKGIVKGVNTALVDGDIPGAGAWLILQYDGTLDKYVLLNPSHIEAVSGPDATPFTDRNRLINGNFAIKQDATYSSGASVPAGGHIHDGWKAGSGGCTLTWATSGIDVVLTITAGTIVQVIDGAEVEGGNYTLSQAGTAQGRVDGGSYVAGNQTVTGKTAGTNITIEFATGTVSKAQFEPGSTATVFDRSRDELRRCLARYWVLGHAVFIPGSQAPGSGYNAAQSISFPVKMRAAPTISSTFSSPTNIGSQGINSSSPFGFTLNIVSAGVGNFQSTYSAGNTADARL